jgi:hypothetical protein
MAKFSSARRKFLLSTAAGVSGVGALIATRPADAFSLHEMNPVGGVGQLYADRCGPGSDHAALMAQLQAQLAADPALQSPLSAMCPICGCPVIASR